MMGIKQLQLTSDSHLKSILSSLHQLRTKGQLCDITVQVIYEGDVKEFQAHQVILATSSGYFKNILLSQDATRDKLSLSNMKSSDFSKFLDFVYTGKVAVARRNIGDIQAVARLLDCESLSEVCDKVLGAGERTKCVSNAKAGDEACSDENGKRTTEKKQTKIPPLKRHLTPQSSEKEEAPQKRFKMKNTPKNPIQLRNRLKLKLVSRKVVRRQWSYSSNEKLHTENQGDDAGSEENEVKDGTQPENKSVEEEEASPKKTASDLDDWDCENEAENVDSHDPLFLLEEGEEGEDEDDDEEEGHSKEKILKTSKAHFPCKKCQRTFQYEKSYVKHISMYHGVKTDLVYRCETCQQKFANRSNLKIHEKHVHSNERLYECDHCTKAFKRKKDVVRHTRQVHERIMQHVCLQCGKALSSKAALLLHERTHTGAKPYECTECKARFTQNSALKMHRRTHTGEKPFACDECDARFTQKHMLAYHKRSHTGEKPFMCEACGKSFASKEYLRHHSNIHTGSKPYKCKQCGRGFAQRNSLNQHLKIHTGERPYSCKDCEKQFTQLNALQRHQRIHTGEKPYMCGLCKRTFTDKSTLRRHTMIHNPDAPWKTYLVVLDGNVEEKKSNSPTKDNTDKAEPEKKKSTSSKGPGADDSAVSTPATSSGTGTSTTQTKTAVVPTEPVRLPSAWASHGAIALVSHSSITVIHTEVPAGTQIQPIVATDGTGASVISLDGSIPVPFSIPVSVAQPVTLSSEAPSTSLSLPTLPIPVSDGLLASVSDNSTVSTSSVLETVASQTILASPLENRSETETSPPDIVTVIVGDHVTHGDETHVVQSDEQENTADDPTVEPKNSTD